MGELHEYERACSDPMADAFAETSFELSSAPAPCQRRLHSVSGRADMARLLSRRLFIFGCLWLVLFADILAPWPIMHPSVAFAQQLKDANPPLSLPAGLTQTSSRTHPNLNRYATPSHATPIPAGEPTQHRWPVSMRPAEITLSAAAQHFVSSDSLLSVDIAAHSLDAAQLASFPGGLRLSISQAKAGDGSNDDSLISFGLYEFQFFDGTGKPATGVRLLHPITIQIHLPSNQQLVWHGQKVFALWTPVEGMSAPPTVASVTIGHGKTSQLTGTVPLGLPHEAPSTINAQGSHQNQTWSIQTTFALAQTESSTVRTRGHNRSGVSAPPAQEWPTASQANTVGFNTQAPQATWGKPADFQVGLNSGGLNYSYPLTIPPGSGGFQPDLSLNYASGSVNENHAWQAASPWVGQGWNLDLGSISWAQENVTPNGQQTLENVWHINDPSGISGQLIPPDVTFTTDGNTLNPSISQLEKTVYIWHSAPESHAKIQEVVFSNVPCWRVYLPNGVMEEFGCTNDSRESYNDGTNWDPYRWNLDLMIDSHGNQVHISYQQLWDSAHDAVRDAVIKDITYDDPNCHQTGSACSSWNPNVDIHFDAGQSATRILNGSGCGGGSSYARCDDPVDVSGGFPAPKVMSAYVLNDVKVEIQGNLLHEYLFSYNQGGPTTWADPNTGMNESAAGYLTLGQIEEEGTNGTSLNAPVITIQYSEEQQHYSDLFSYSYNNGSDCSPYKYAPTDGFGGPCFLWSNSFNQYYITNLDNGEGWNESISWHGAHSNTWGVDSGSVNNAFTCYDNQSPTNWCGKADDKNWSRVVVASRTATSNGVSSTWSYSYYLTQVNASIPGYETRSCQSACESYDWGNQNDDDSADYYNGDFQSFAKTQVILPDGSSQIDTYGSTNGWGIFNNQITCSNGNNSCSYAPYNASNGPVLAGKQLSEEDDNSSGKMKVITWSWSTNCPPPGVPASNNAPGYPYSPPGAPDPTFLFSRLDQNNPTMVCDPRATQEVSTLYDGDGGNPSIATTTNYTYDGNSCGNTGYDYGNLTKQDETATDVGGAHIVDATSFCPNDNINPSSGIYLTDLPMQTQTQDKPGMVYSCSQITYGSDSGYNQQPSVPDVTRTDDFTGYFYTGNCSGTDVKTLHSYDQSGNAVTDTDPDNHLGCDSNQYSACATYDSFAAHLLTATNAKNQITTYGYDQDAPEAGYGEWLMSETDPNGQTTTYTYDALGRLTAVIRPGDSLDNPTITYTYINHCSPGKTTPCLEIDTATRFSSSGDMSTEKQFYDGWGNLVETQTPGPNLFSKVPYIPSLLINYTYTDFNSQTGLKETATSLPYAVAASSGLSYVTPDLNQPRTLTTYDSLGRTIGTVTYGQGQNMVEEATTSYSVAQGVPTIPGESGNTYEQAKTLDGYNHQSITYTDGFGRTRYSQAFSGTGSYNVIRTVGTMYDTVGNTLSVTTYDSTGTPQATYSATYDGLKRLTGYNDSDLGSCSDTPMPADCSGSTDTAWKYTYDADGNQLSQTDPRNENRYTSYDALDRPLCSALTAADASSCSGSTDEVYFYDGYSNASTPGATFPTGCTAPSGNYASDPIDRKTAEIFIGTSGAGSGWRCYGYDQRGETDQRTLSVTTPDAGTITQTVNMAYNDGGELASLTYPNGQTLTSNYDVNGRTQSAYFGTPSSPDPVNFLVGQVSYTNDGQLAGLALGGSGPKAITPTNTLFSTTESYDSIQRPLSESATMTGQNQPFFSQTRAYDAIGNVIQLLTTIPTSGGGTKNDNQSYCYDDLSRLVWNGNNGTPTGGDDCGPAPTGTTIAYHHQAYSYDELDRMTSGREGTDTYGDMSSVHAITNLSDVPNQYAAYDAMGNMTCQNTDTTSAHTCSGSSPTGATMSYNSQGQLVQWTAPSGTTASDTFLYDDEGNRVLQSASSTVNGTTTVTDTITFDGYTESTLTGGTTTTLNYYSLDGQRLAVQQGTSPLIYLISDLLGSVDVAVNAGGTIAAVQLYWPYGEGEYSWGTMPTTYNFTGQRLDSVTGLLYYNARYYDPFSGRFTRADTVENNAKGKDPYAYVSDDPVGKTDPSGHDGSWWQTALTITAIAVVVAVVVVAAVVAAPVVIAAAATAAELAATAVAADGAVVAGAATTAAVVGTVAETEADNVAATAADTAVDVATTDTADSTLSDAVESCGLSFRADTLVATPKGEQAIGTLNVGSKVQAYNPATKTTSTQAVQQVFVNHDTDLIDVTLAVHPAAKQTKSQQVAVVSHGSHAPPVTVETVHTTQKHPWLTTKGWITAGQLRLGDQVQELNGMIGTVVALKVIPGAADMYDLTVSNVHTFAVGIGQFVVHNCSDLSESGIKDYLSQRGARMTNESDLNLAQNANRIYLGHYGGEGIVVNGTDYPSSSLPGLSTLQQFAKSYGGRTLDFLPYDFAAMQPHIETADEILFNVGRNGIDSGSLTAQEFQFVIDREDILRKTLFLFGATY